MTDLLLRQQHTLARLPETGPEPGGG